MIKSEVMNTKLLNEIKRVLLEFPSYWDNDELITGRLIEDLRSYKTELIYTLLRNDLIKETYSLKVEDSTVFKLEEFIRMLRFRQHWGSNYTNYSNEIGLTTEGKYFKYNEDVVLDFPYKDSVLEGGMTKEEYGKREVFYHNVLAKEEIDTLLSNKVLVNMKRYDEEGKHDTTEFKDTDNLILKGNNLVALNLLLENYRNRVRTIFIDPPYYFNKTTSGDSFKYNSKFKLSTWLVFLKNRLEIAKDLMRTDGSIWINISEDGMHYLKVMADSIFGKEHFVGTIPRKTRDGKSDVPFNLSQDFDWILVYTKSNEDAAVVGREVQRKYITTPDFPNRPWRQADLTKQTTLKERENSNFVMVNPKTGKEYPPNPKRSWAVTKDTFQYWYDRGGIGFPDDYSFMSGNKPFRRVFKDEDDSKGKPTSVNSDFILRDFITTLLTKAKNKQGNDEIDALFGRDEFDYAKPENLIKAILEVSTKEDDLVLDFFMGSATTQAVAHKMGRQYIGIEQMDYINTISVPRLQEVIEGEQGGVSEELEWRGGGSFVYAELYELNNKHIQDVIETSSEKELKTLLDKLLATEYLNFKVDFEELSRKSGYFKDLTLEEKKSVVVEVLDLNQLYLNYSEIDDKKHGIQEDVKRFNHSFYKGEENEDEQK